MNHKVETSKIQRNSKVDPPTFNGKLDQKVYINWEVGIERYFKLYNLSEEKKCQFVQLKLVDKARLYWEQVERLNLHRGDLPITNWKAIKLKLRSKYVPSYY